MKLRPCRAAWIFVLLPLLGCGDGDPGGGADTESAQATLQNTLRWTTASELDNYGYDIFRATSEDGPFEVINDSPVPGAGTTDVPQSYEYVDRDVEPDTEYFYYVESISMSGQRERATPTIRAIPKEAPGGPDG